MLLIISLIIVAIFIYLFKASIKSNANAFYIGAAAISIAVFLLGYADIPVNIQQNILGIVSKGSLGTALFVVVMYTGALPRESKLMPVLMRIRGELSITAAVLVLCHNATYGRIYFQRLLFNTDALSGTQLAAALVSIVLIALMLVLTVTSFPKVRRAMQPIKWKKLQRSAYVFYGLMYVHIMLINVPLARQGIRTYIVNVFVYSLVFIGYAAMRVSKYIVKRTGVTKNSNGMAAGVTSSKIKNVSKPTKIDNDKTDNKENEIITEKVSNESKVNNAGKLAISKLDKSKWERTSSVYVVHIIALLAFVLAVSTCFIGVKNDDEFEIGSGSATSSGSSGAGSSNSAGGSNSSGNTYKSDGQYTGTAVCETYGYTVTVTLTIKNDRIADVTAVSEADSHDTEYFEMASASVPAAIVEKQGSKGVDSVSGATLSSKAIKQAFYNAYKSALK